MEEKSLIESYVPIPFFWAALLILSGALLSIGAVFAGGFLLALADSLAAIWVGAGALLAAISIWVLVRFLDELTARRQHREEIETLQAQALVRERQPEPRAETLAVTSGIEIERVGNLIDRRDLEYFAEQIAATKDWTARRWENITLPYGYHITNRDGSPEHPTSYAKLIALFTDCKPPLIVERSDRKTGVLTETDPGRMVKLIIGSTVH